MTNQPSSYSDKPALRKSLTGIAGFDEISYGGLPYARPTLVCGGAGSGKTLFGMEYLVNGIQHYNEPGVFIAFEENRQELLQNIASLNFYLPTLIEQNKLFIDQISFDAETFEQAGEYDLDGLLIRLDTAIKKVNAQRIVLDSIEVLFTVLGDTNNLRSELGRLFRWLKNKGISSIITAERGDGTLTRHDIEAYISDCVISLEQRAENQLTRRHLRIVKYRGSKHSLDEYPFLIDETGLTLFPITSIGLEYSVSNEYVSTGVHSLDKMLSGKGLFRGSTALISGPSGTGKTSFGAQFVNTSCQRGERCLYFSFEESPQQIIRNIRSINVDLQIWVDMGLLHFHTARPTTYGLETHLVTMYRLIQTFKPHCIVLDPVTNFDVIGSATDSQLLFLQLIDFCKMQGVTTFLTSLSNNGERNTHTEINISSLVDTWMSIQDIESNGERNRTLYILKSRGMKHSNQIIEFEITSEGINLVDTYLGNSGVLTGSARLAQEAQLYNTALENQQKIELKRLQLEHKHAAINAQIQSLMAEIEVEKAEMELLLNQEKARKDTDQRQRERMAQKRGVLPN